jgi:hypothetical protein
MITGPSILPYRMEELTLTFGRHSYSHRVRDELFIFLGTTLIQESDVHIGSQNPKISHVHAKIEYNPTSGSYRLLNLSKNGTSFKSGTANFVKVIPLT